MDMGANTNNFTFVCLDGVSLRSIESKAQELDEEM
jgi:hypothetical protein